MSKPVQFQGWPESLSVPYGPYRAVIERIVDGDTVHVMVSLGMDEYAYRMIRIKDAFAPELFSGPPEELDFSQLRAKGVRYARHHSPPKEVNLRCVPYLPRWYRRWPPLRHFSPSASLGTLGCCS